MTMQDPNFVYIHNNNSCLVAETKYDSTTSFSQLHTELASWGLWENIQPNKIPTYHRWCQLCMLYPGALRGDKIGTPEEGPNLPIWWKIVCAPYMLHMEGDWPIWGVVAPDYLRCSDWVCVVPHPKYGAACISPGSYQGMGLLPLSRAPFIKTVG